LKNILIEKGFFVQAQGSFSHRTSIDQRGEQTINKNAKTAGGIENFASDPSGILKWVLNCPEQARNTEKMIELAGLQSTCEFKPLRRSQIRKSEENVQRIISVLTDYFIDLFSISTDIEHLLNFSSGVVNDT